MNPALRRRLLQVHRWAGLTVGVLVVFLGVTGLALVFRPQLEPLLEAPLHRAGACARPLSLDSIAASALAAHPQGVIDQVKIVGQEPVVVRFADKNVAYVGQCDGAVLAQRQRWAGLLNTFEQLHRWRFLASADAADTMTGSAALVTLTCLVIPGLILWWPRSWLALRRALQPPPLSKLFVSDLSLHRVVGAYVSLVLLVVTITAQPMAFGWARQLIHWASGSAPQTTARPLSISPEPGVERLAMEAQLRRARALVPGAVQIVLTYPRQLRDPIRISALAPDAPHSEATSTLVLDAYSGEVSDFQPYARSSLGNKIIGWASAVHMGRVGGWLGQCLLFVGVFGVPVLGYTGMRSYYRRRFQARPASRLLSLRIARIGFDGAEIKLFELIGSTNAPLPAFTPGAHVDVHVVPGLVRQYSLCGDPADSTRYRIAVRRASQSRGGSRAIHELWAEGDRVLVGAPRNHFSLEPRAAHHLLLAGGIGITPMIAMVTHLQRTGASFELHHFVRSKADAALSLLLPNAEVTAKVHFHPLAEAESQALELRRLLSSPPPNAHLYLCGSRRFMALARDIAEPDWPPAAIHVEHFSADPAAAAGPSKPFDVVLARSGTQCRVEAGQSIAECLRHQGLEVSTSCTQGVCGSCLTAVLSGTPDHRDAYLSENDRKAGTKIMICVSRARSARLVLDI